MEEGGQGGETRQLAGKPPKTAPSRGETAAALVEWEAGASERQAHLLILQAAGLAAIPTDNSWLGRIGMVQDALQKFDQGAVLTMLSEARQAWIATPRKNSGGTYSVLNPAWVDWGIAALSGEKPWAGRAGKTNAEIIKEIVDE